MSCKEQVVAPPSLRPSILSISHPHAWASGERTPSCLYERRSFWVELSPSSLPLLLPQPHLPLALIALCQVRPSGTIASHPPMPFRERGDGTSKSVFNRVRRIHSLSARTQLSVGRVSRRRVKESTVSQKDHRLPPRNVVSIDSEKQKKELT